MHLGAANTVFAMTLNQFDQAPSCACSHFHHGYNAPPSPCSNCDIQPDDYNNNVGRVQTCDLLGLPDLDTGNSYVRQASSDGLIGIPTLGRFCACR